MDYYSAIKKRTITVFAAICANLKTTTLSKRSQPQMRTLHDSIYVKFKNRQN